MEISLVSTKITFLLIICALQMPPGTVAESSNVNLIDFSKYNARYDQWGWHEEKLPQPFQFFGIKYDTLWIYLSGIIRFSTEWDWGTCTATGRKHDTGSVVLPYYADGCYTREMLHLKGNDEAVISHISQDVYQAFSRNKSSLKWYSVFTWNDTENCKGKSPSTFQAVLTSDGQRSFVLLYYKQLYEYYSRDYASAGIFNDTKSYNLPGSCSSRDMPRELTSGSNVNFPGKFVFRVDSDDIILPESECLPLNIETELSEFKSSLFGRGVVWIEDRCLEPFDGDADASLACTYQFEGKNVSTSGEILKNGNGVICAVPTFASITPVLLTVVVYSHRVVGQKREFTVPVHVEHYRTHNELLHVNLKVLDTKLVELRASWDPYPLDPDPILPSLLPRSESHYSIGVMITTDGGRWTDGTNIFQSLDNTGSFKSTFNMSNLNLDLQPETQIMFYVNQRLILTNVEFDKRLVSAVFSATDFCSTGASDVVCVDKYISASEKGAIVFNGNFLHFLHPAANLNATCHFLPYNNGTRAILVPAIIQPCVQNLLCPTPLLSMLDGKAKVELIIMLDGKVITKYSQLVSVVKRKAGRNQIFSCVTDEDLLDFSKQTFSLKIEPSVISVFGNVPLMVYGPRFPATPTILRCTYLSSDSSLKIAETEGLLLSPEKSLTICSVPFLGSLGRVRLELLAVFSFQPTTFYKGSFQVVAHTQENLKSRLSVQLEHKEELNELIGVSVSWNQTSSTTDKIQKLIDPDISEMANETEIVLFENNGKVWKEFVMLLTSHLNLSVVATQLNLCQITRQAAVTSIFLIGVRSSFTVKPNTKVSDVISQTIESSLKMNSKLRRMCREDNQNAKKGESDCVDATANLGITDAKKGLVCPSTVEQAKVDWRFFQSDNNILPRVFGNGSSFSQAVPAFGVSTNCIYNEHGNLSPTSHVQRHGPTDPTNYWNYFVFDLNPFLSCCNTRVCSKNLFLKRAQVDDVGYLTPLFSGVSGTGVISTFGEKTYLLNSPGEYIGVQYPDTDFQKTTGFQPDSMFQQQLRFENASVLNLNGKNSLVLTTIAMMHKRHGLKSTILVSRRATCFEILINDGAVIPDTQWMFTESNESKHASLLYFEGGILRKLRGDRQLLVNLASGLSALISLAPENEKALSLVTSVSPDIIQNTTGLLHWTSSFTPDVNNLTTLPEKFLVKENETLFSHLPGNSWIDYNPPLAGYKMSYLEQQNDWACEIFECCHEAFLSMLPCDSGIISCHKLFEQCVANLKLELSEFYEDTTIISLLGSYNQ